MCGRYFLHREAQRLSEYFGAAGVLPNQGASWNIAPTQDALVLRHNPVDRMRHLSMLRWGLVPHWSKDGGGGAKLINARAEGIATRPSFRDAFMRRRCLVPADGFYEWRQDGKLKQAYAVALKTGAPMALAGLWEGWKSPDGNWVRTFSIITTEANSKQALVHSRMPAILPRESWPAWLGEEPSEPAHLAEMLRPCPDDWLSCWPVSARVGSVRENDTALLQRDPLAMPPPELDDAPILQLPR